MKKSISIFTLALVASMMFAIGCDDDDGGSADKLTLSEHTPATVVISLDTASDLASLSFDLSEENPTDAQYDSFVESVNTAAITLSVVNNDTAVSVNLADGTMVTEEPAAAGEYMVSMTDGVIEMIFYNEIDGLVLNVGGDYTAALDVMENDDFTTETFTRAVEVQ